MPETVPIKMVHESLATGPPRCGAGVGVGMLRGAEVPLLENTKITKFPFHVFLIDMKFISKILKNISRGSSSFSGARLRTIRSK